MTRTSLVLAIVLAAGAACGPDLEILGAVQLRGPACTATAASPELRSGLADIGVSEGNTNEYLAALIIDVNGDALVSYDADDAFFTRANGDALDTGGHSATKPRTVEMGGTSAQPFASATIISHDDAATLQTSTDVSGAISASGFASIIAHVVVHGTTIGGQSVSSQAFSVPMVLCAGCLTSSPACFDTNGTPETNDDIPVAPILNPALCAQGNDEPTFVCPN
ncbi:MAG TPA: hypothetical protein VGO62_09880 [Myxococcota bacterium]